MNNDINEKIVHAAPVPPFVSFVASAVPMVFDNSMSYYEALCALWKWLQDDVIDVINNNASVTEQYITLTNELKEFVENYFDNLDVQEEINHKLDEMVVNGTFQAILDSYVEPTLNQMRETIDDNKVELEDEINSAVTDLTSSIETERNSRVAADNDLHSQITGLASGAPTPVSSTAGMTNHSKVYVNTTDGKWYYWNGAAWTAGGVYQASQVETDTTLTQAGVPADAKATGKAINAVKNVTTRTVNETIVKNPVTDTRTSGYISKDGTVHSSQSYEYVILDCEEGDKFVAYTGASLRFVCAYVNGVADSSLGSDSSIAVYVVPENVDKVAISIPVNQQFIGYFYNRNALHNYFEPSKVIEVGDKGKVDTENIFGMLKTTGNVMSNNIMGNAELMQSGAYIDIDSDSGYLIYRTNASYNSYRVRINSNYMTFTNARFACITKADGYTVIGSLLSNITTLNISDPSSYYVYFSINNGTYTSDNFVVKSRQNNYILPTNWVLSGRKDNTQIETGTLTNGSSIKIESYGAIKDGYSVTAQADITEFYKLRLGFNSSSNVISNYIDVTSDSVIIKSNTSDPQTFTHGLTIADDISIKFVINNSIATITITSKGVSYVKNIEWVQINATSPYPILISDGTTATSAKLSLDIPAAKREIWIFGDSYLGVTSSSRWAYYLVQDDLYKNALLNGSAGSTSYGASTAISTLVNMGTPKYAVLATGMNDGGDTGDTPSSTWTTYKNSFLDYCSANGITPILATIPTVPTVNNEAKNAWVKASGYRYIDFAKAVGADSDGTWYTGMLSLDGVHPSELGAKALYNQVLVDLPEIFG